MQIVNVVYSVKAALMANLVTKKDDNKRFLNLMAFVFLGMVVLVPEVAMAAPWDSAASKVVAIFTGELSRSIAMTAVAACGIASLAGKLSWNWAINIVIGIVLIFGSAAIVDFLRS